MTNVVGKPTSGAATRCSACVCVYVYVYVSLGWLCIGACVSPPLLSPVAVEIVAGLHWSWGIFGLWYYGWMTGRLARQTEWLYIRVADYPLPPLPLSSSHTLFLTLFVSVWSRWLCDCDGLCWQWQRCGCDNAGNVVDWLWILYEHRGESGKEQERQQRNW